MSGMPPGIDVAELARALAAYIDPDALWTGDDVAAHLRRAPRYVTEKMAKAPGFPKAIRMPLADGKRGAPLWRRSAILEWVSRVEQGYKPQGGRPRLRPDD